MKAARFCRISWIVTVCLAGIALGACHKKNTEKKSSKASKQKEKPATLATPGPQGMSAAQLAGEIEKLTSGAHTRIVWEQSQNPRKPDPFSYGDEQMLKGFDTRDGRGERTLQSEKGNYTRPLLSADGELILFTKREVDRKGRFWMQQCEIFRTDWKGSPPVKLGDGLAVDFWRDPATRTDWVYAVQEWDRSAKTTSDPKRLVRLPLLHPEKIEQIYDDTRLDYDNIQLSRDGTMASGGFPWPNAGVFLFENGTVATKKLRNGCWPSCAPDNSHVSWVFDGNHRSATFFSGDGAKSWVVDFNPPNTGRREMFHPRWTNHPRFLAITGPYKSKSGNAIKGGGGRSAEVYLGRFSPALDRVEAWVQITDNDLSDGYPDVWIEGGDKAQLSGFGGPAAVTSARTPAAEVSWPAKKDGILFLWRNSSAQNNWRSPDGKNHFAELENHGAARFGRVFEMVLAGGVVEVPESTAGGMVQILSGSADVTFEALVLPAEFEGGRDSGSESKTAFLFRGPGLDIGLQERRLVLHGNSNKAWISRAPVPGKPFHLAVVRQGDAFQALVNGASLPLNPQDAAPPGQAVDMLTFGGGWNGGLLDIALYHRPLDAGEIAQNSAAVLREAGKFPPAPPRVSLRGRVVESSSPPALEDIAPYTGSLIANVYEVEKVLSGEFKDKRILVKHWGLLNKTPVPNFPRDIGKSFELVVEKESDHPELRGERVTDETTAFDLESWVDVSLPQGLEQSK